MNLNGIEAGQKQSLPALDLRVSGRCCQLRLALPQAVESIVAQAENARIEQLNLNGPMRAVLQVFASVLSVLLLGGCLTDAATRLAYDLEAGAGQVGGAEGATYTVVHRVPSSAGECVGPYRVQLDKVGAIIVWCKDTAGDTTVSSHSMSYHARFDDTSETRIVDKPANEVLVIELERRYGRIVIASVR